MQPRLPRPTPYGPDRVQARLGPRVELGRAIRSEARAMVATRGALAEAAAWAATRAPGLTCPERGFREWVAQRVSRMFAFVGIDHQH